MMDMHRRPRPEAGSALRRLGSQRTVLAMLALATAIASTGLAAGGTAGALLGEALAGTDAVAGLPLGVLVVGSAATALVVSRQASRIGWGRGLMLGYIAGALGGLLVIAAAAVGNFGVLLVGSSMLGAANSSVFLTRYAAAEIAGAAERGRALGAIFFATAIGAVASPSLLGPSGVLAQAVGLPPLAGLYVIAVASFGAAALLLAAMSHPAAPYIGRGAALLGPGDASDPNGPGGPSRNANVARREIASGLKVTPAKVALIVLATTNLIMVAVMAVAPLHLMHMTAMHMTAESHDLQITGVVVSIHVAGMFAPSPITGWLADRIGSAVVALTGVSLLIAASLAGILISQGSAFSMGIMLIILGVGWNCGVVGGSVLLADSVPPALRPQVEGIGEAAMGLAAALGAPMAGVIAALGGIPALSLAGATVALCSLAFACRTIRRGQLTAAPISALPDARGRPSHRRADAQAVCRGGPGICPESPPTHPHTRAHA